MVLFLYQTIKQLLFDFQTIIKQFTIIVWCIIQLIKQLDMYEP